MCCSILETVGEALLQAGHTQVHWARGGWRGMSPSAPGAAVTLPLRARGAVPEAGIPQHLARRRSGNVENTLAQSNAVLANPGRRCSSAAVLRCTTFGICRAAAGCAGSASDYD